MANYGIQFKDKNGNKYYPCPFPVGFVVLTTSKVNPSTYWGGTWVQMYGGYLYACQNTAGQTSYTGWGTQGHALNTSQMPKHSHTRGTMNITGWLGLGWNDQSAPTVILNRGWGGAFSGSNSGRGNQYYTYTGSGPHSHYNDQINLNAADGWTGSTSEVGSGSAHSHNIASVDVFAWKRTA